MQLESLEGKTMLGVERDLHSPIEEAPTELELVTQYFSKWETALEDKEMIFIFFKFYFIFKFYIIVLVLEETGAQYWRALVL